MFSEFSFLFSDICFAVCKVVGGVVIIKVGSINNRAISCTVHSADGSSYWKDRAPTLETTSLLCFISQLLLLLRGISSTGLLFLTPALCFQCSNATNNNSMISTYQSLYTLETTSLLCFISQPSCSRFLMLQYRIGVDNF